MAEEVTVLVAYYSRGGTTKSMAESVAKGVKEAGGEPLLRSVEEVTEDDMLTCKGLILGSPVYFGTMAAPVKEFIDKHIGLRKKMEDKVGAAFVSAGHHTGGKETTLMSILQGMLIYGMIIVGDPLKASGHYGVACHGNLLEETDNHARMLGARVTEVAGKIF
ncbi:MAG: flavodoxin family protein [Lentisphaeria bacterium]